MKKILLLILFLQIFSVKTKKRRELRQFSFRYAFDCSYLSQYFPRKGQSFTAGNIGFPRIKYAVPGNTNVGNWRLIPKSYFTGNLNDYPGYKNLQDSLNDIAVSYGVPKGNLIIYELKDGDKHIAYGVVIYYEDNLIMFYGDTSTHWRCYFLTNQSSLPASFTKTTTEDIITGIKELIIDDSPKPAPTPAPTPAPAPAPTPTPASTEDPCDELINELKRKIEIFSALLAKR